MRTQTASSIQKYLFTGLLLWTSYSTASVLESVRDPSSFAPQQFNSYLFSDSRIIDKDRILEDRDNKISDEFKIKPEFKKRVSFWFDVYTKYSAQEEVIHHADYPWIVFRIIDLRPLLDAPGNRWTNYHKSKKYAKNQLKDVKNILLALSKKKSFDKLQENERVIFEQLAEIPGTRKKVILTALASLRTQVGQKDYIENGLSQSSLYTEKLEEIFAANKLPLELTRLPFVESSFNTQAVSKVGASGIWQVMPYIGKKFLVMNTNIDERNSPVKSAKAAAFILKENKMILKSWPLALTAYNHGSGSILKAIKVTKSRDLQVMLQKYKAKSFGFASQNFYSSFLAILHAEKYRQEAFRSIEPLKTLSYSEIKLAQKIKIKDLLKLAAVSNEEFKRLNLDIKESAFKKNIYLPKGYIVHLPKDIAQNVTAKNKKLVLLMDSVQNMKIRL